MAVAPGAPVPNPPEGSVIPPAGNPGQAPPTDPSADDPKRPETVSASEHRKAQKELAKAQKELEDLRAAEEARKKAEMSELDRLKAEKEEAIQKLRQAELDRQIERKHTAFRLAVMQAGAVDADAAIKLADLSEIEIDNGQVAGVDETVEKFKTAYPYMFGQPRSAGQLGASGGNPGKAPGATKYDSKAIRNMSAAEFKEFDQAVRRGKIRRL